MWWEGGAPQFYGVRSPCALNPTSPHPVCLFIWLFICILYNKLVEMKVLVSQSCLTLCLPMDCTHQAPPSMGFSRQEYWSGLPFPSPGDLPDPGIKPRSPALQMDTLPCEPPAKANIYISIAQNVYVFFPVMAYPRP